MSEFYCPKCKRRYAFPFSEWKRVLEHHDATCETEAGKVS